MAATMPTQIRIEKNVKEQATALFADLGLDMSSAVNIFLRQCILRGGLPFLLLWRCCFATVFSPSADAYCLPYRMLFT